MSGPVRAAHVPRRLTPAGCAALLLALAGCGPSSEPVTWPADEDLGLPAVEWPFGAPDVSDEWVAAVYDAEIALAAAQNAHDFSGPAVSRRVEPENAADWARSAGMRATDPVSGAARFAYFPGPRSRVVTGVEVQGDRAAVTTCAAAESWTGWEGPGATRTQLRAADRGTVMVYDMRRDPDGEIRWYGYGEARAAVCEITDLRLGYFAPEPPYGQPVARSDVLGPDGEPAVDPRFW